MSFDGTTATASLAQIPSALHERDDRRGTGSAPAGRQPSQKIMSPFLTSATEPFQGSISWPAEPARPIAGQSSRAALFAEIDKRILNLKIEAQAEQINISEKSIDTLVFFLRSTIFSNRPAIFLSDNGNFRAVWKNQNREQIAIQFGSDLTSQAVFFYINPATLLMNREALELKNADLLVEIHKRKIGYLLGEIGKAG
ncbi:MAG: hypothetical protein IOC90_05120 [Methylocystis sp.]|nr:hypothetical protein [Methylocystis sp.]MCA3584374.1 hypothetical protein [Methylocystis sp.]MCA3587399.1 hypothetical protein [Methylocystis sp.]MCA3592605.1 hypothetical protein [Methylocystis sp.]